MEPNIDSKVEEVSSYDPVPGQRAGFGDRFFAAFVDNIIVNIPLRLLLRVIIPVLADPFFGAIMALLIQLTAVICYFAGFAYIRKGQTFGKKWGKIKVVDANGNDLTLGHFIIREFVARGTPIIISAFVGYYALLWTLTYTLAMSKDKRALHDIIVGTQVIMVN